MQHTLMVHIVRIYEEVIYEMGNVFVCEHVLVVCATCTQYVLTNVFGMSFHCSAV